MIGSDASVTASSAPASSAIGVTASKYCARIRSRSFILLLLFFNAARLSHRDEALNFSHGDSSFLPLVGLRNVTFILNESKLFNSQIKPIFTPGAITYSSTSSTTTSFSGATSSSTTAQSDRRHRVLSLSHLLLYHSYTRRRCAG